MLAFGQRHGCAIKQNSACHAGYITCVLHKLLAERNGWYGGSEQDVCGGRKNPAQRTAVSTSTHNVMGVHH